MRYRVCRHGVVAYLIVWTMDLWLWFTKSAESGWTMDDDVAYARFCRGAGDGS